MESKLSWSTSPYTIIICLHCFLFCKAKEREVGALLDTLHKYEELSGHGINMEKSKINFGRKTSAQMKE